ncbi:MAG: chorismate-binding protein [Magnetococcales bacterium]|nr:chorismate-binding protein [Magnetococcales bacterium]
MPVRPALLRDGICLLVDFAALGRPLFFCQPSRCLIAWRPEEVTPVVRAAEAAARAGNWVGGFLAYEAAAAFDLPVCAPEAGMPLAWFAVFATAQTATLLPPAASWAGSPVPLITRERFHHDLNAIHAEILAGATYQVNYTLPARVPHVDDLAALFLRTHLVHRHPFAAWLHLPATEGMSAWSLASFSPELFLQRSGNTLISAPIKGTRARSRARTVDADRVRALNASVKDRAEHVMIVDMVRNDLGRVSRIGSVSVPRLGTWRPFSTIHHLETRVLATVDPQQSDAAEILAALFPAASITGAPKHQTMTIIRDLEQRARGIYTGAIGLFQPGGDFIFNVAIRTVVQRNNEPPQIGIGGGVVADSNPAAEWTEAASKGQFLAAGALHPPLGLIETMRVEAGGHIPMLDQHLGRLQASARALGIPLEATRVADVLRQRALTLNRAGMVPWVLRLELQGDGRFRLSDRRLPATPATLRVRVAEMRIDRFDHRHRHKTTHRDHFESALRQARWGGFDDALFLNDEGRVTEGAIRGILVRRGEQWHTPPLEEGLLASLWRAQRMVQLKAQETPITLEMLVQAEEIRMGNAVQGGRPVAHLVDVAGRTVWRWRGGENQA